MESNAAILIVSGNRERGERCASYLRPAYEVTTATDVESARAALDREIDVVFVDDDLPDGSGEDVVRVLRGRDVRARAAVFTPSVPQDDVADRGFDEFLVTPVADDELVAAVERLLDLLAYDEKLRESAELASERASMAAGTAEESGDVEARYSHVNARLDQLEEDLRTIGGRIGTTGYRVAFRDIGDE
ncbi:HalX domain-containing protein [Halobium palmae]|uniref:HalX domain-containing protein n=1 Tax=Halobium palmae TaxID=1776492 RepID=A0ABD5RWQ0_9EURY